jgi:hypothetical protein
VLLHREPIHFVVDQYLREPLLIPTPCSITTHSPRGSLGQSMEVVSWSRCGGRCGRWQGTPPVSSARRSGCTAAASLRNPSAPACGPQSGRVGEPAAVLDAWAGARCPYRGAQEAATIRASCRASDPVKCEGRPWRRAGRFWPSPEIVYGGRHVHASPRAAGWPDRRASRARFRRCPADCWAVL